MKLSGSEHELEPYSTQHLQTLLSPGFQGLHCPAVLSLFCFLCYCLSLNVSTMNEKLKAQLP